MKRHSWRQQRYGNHRLYLDAVRQQVRLQRARRGLEPPREARDTDRVHTGATNSLASMYEAMEKMRSITSEPS